MLTMAALIKNPVLSVVWPLPLPLADYQARRAADPSRPAGRKEVSVQVLLFTSPARHPRAPLSRLLLWLDVSFNALWPKTTPDKSKTYIPWSDRKEIVKTAEFHMNIEALERGTKGLFADLRN